MPTIFEQILSGEIPSKIILETEKVFAIKDIAPQAPVHLLIVSKKVIPCLQEVKEEDFEIIKEMYQAAQILAKEYNLDKSGYRLVTNNGKNAGQIIFHLHFHLLGGCLLEGRMC